MIEFFLKFRMFITSSSDISVIRLGLVGTDLEIEKWHGGPSGCVLEVSSLVWFRENQLGRNQRWAERVCAFAPRDGSDLERREETLLHRGLEAHPPSPSEVLRAFPFALSE